MFVDASAAVAIILDEPECKLLRQKLKSASRRTMSAISTYEAVMAIRKVKRVNTADAHVIVEQFQEMRPVSGIQVDGLAVIAPIGNMVPAILEIDSQGASHTPRFCLR